MSVQTFVTKVKAAFKLRPQPNGYTCQSAAIAMATGGDIAAIRADLCAHGEAGDPFNMGRLLKAKLGDRYSFNPEASMLDAKKALTDGCYCIVHGWFTGSGHVIGLDGAEIDRETLSYKFSVKDPWSEFDFASWSYPGTALGFDGFYSSYGIYAACVAGQSKSHAAQIYRRRELNSGLKGMWLHTIAP
jgi:hypothetical protein